MATRIESAPNVSTGARRASRYSLGASLRRSMSQFALTSPTSMLRFGGADPIKRRSRYVALATSPSAMMTKDAFMERSNQQHTEGMIRV